MLSGDAPLVETLWVLRSGQLDLAEYINAIFARLQEVEGQVQALVPEDGRQERLLKEAKRLLERFPDVKLYLAHSKASWVHLYLEKTEGYLWLSTQRRPVSLEPDEIFFGASTLVSFDTVESAVAEVSDLFESWAAWGSSYPNRDTHTPSDCLARLERNGVPEAVQRKLMGGNLAHLLGVP